MIDERGYVSIVGRAKDLIICGGFTVYPAEVEALLDATPGVAESAVIGVPHPDMGEGIVAVVRRSAPEIDEASVLAGLDGQLARFKQPRRAMFVADLPRNAIGKVQKKELRDACRPVRARGGLSDGDDRPPPLPRADRRRGMIGPASA